MRSQKPNVPAIILICSLWLTTVACHTPLRDQPQSRDKHGRTSADPTLDTAEKEDESSDETCLAVAASLSQLNVDGHLQPDLETLTAEFPPVLLLKGVIRHVAVMQIAKGPSQEMHLFSVFVDQQSCTSLQIREETLLNDDGLKNLKCSLPHSDPKLDRVFANLSVSPGSLASKSNVSPYQSEFGGQLQESITVFSSTSPQASSEKSLKVSMLVLNQENCAVDLDVTRPVVMHAPGSIRLPKPSPTAVSSKDKS